MPNPGRTVAKSVSVLIRLGFTRAESLQMVMSICEHVQAQDDGAPSFNWQWIEQVYREAERRLEQVRGS